MSIPTGQEYMMPELGLGKIASYQRSQVDSAAVKRISTLAKPFKLSMKRLAH